MSERYPRIRVFSKSGVLVIREGLSINFYMRHSHAAVAQAVMRALETYRHAIEAPALHFYASEEGAWEPLDDAGWEHVRRELLDDRLSRTLLTGTAASGGIYQFEYYGREVEESSPDSGPGPVSAVSFWLPTEYLEEHGPEKVHALALQLAAPLPFCTGHAGLAFHTDMDLLGMAREVHQRCFRYPGLDIPDLQHRSWKLGTRICGPFWLNFLGQPMLGALGNVEGLRARLHSDGTLVQELEGQRAVITLGPCPQAGDAEQGRVLPNHRELAHVQEPWLYHRERGYGFDFTLDEVHRWERRFLD